MPISLFHRTYIITFILLSSLAFKAMANSADSKIQIEFAPISLSGLPLHHSVVSQKVTINGQTQTLKHTTLFTTGQKDNSEVFGLIKDIANQPIQFTDQSDYICNGTNDGVGSGLDHISILQKNNKLFMVSQYECAIGALYMNELIQNETGQLSVKPNSLRYIDQSSEFGGFVHCAGQTTPWQSHLSSEEYEPNAQAIEQHFNPVSGLTGIGYYDELRHYWQGDLTRANPYFYGWVPEITINPDNQPVYTKHYSMGRFSHELAYVMPDQKTVYMSDDGTNGGFYLYIADRPQDLSSGHLYAAQWQQTSNQGLGKAQINWVDLGHSTDANIRHWVAKKLTFSDIFERYERNNQHQCPKNSRSVNTMFGSECLSLKDINQDHKINQLDRIIAARLETRRMAAYLGATTEFRKAEGITFNPQKNHLYLAVSEISRGMENFKKNSRDNNLYDDGGANHIQLPYNPCGGIYKLNLTAQPQMQSEFIATHISGLIAGVPSKTKTNSCTPNQIANPDNISFLEGSNSLIIGEDSERHPNNLLWSYNTDTTELTPIMSIPAQAEATSPFWHKNINGYGYITIVTQHPLKTQPVSESKKQSFAEVLGPFKF